MNKLFEKDARVAFIGDSITHNGGAVSHVQDYYYKNLPERRVRIFNLGIGGDTARGATGRIDEILSVRPTEAVVMFGVNDMGVGYYDKSPSEEHLRLRAERRKAHLDAIKELVFRLRELSLPVTLCSAVGRDELSPGDCNTTGATAALYEMFGDNVTAIGVENLKNTVDYLTPLQKLQGELVAVGGPSLFVPDRTHPSPLGQQMMARIFLAAQGLEVSLPSAREIADGWCEEALSAPIRERCTFENSWRNLHFVYPHQRNLCGEIPLKERIEFFRARIESEPVGYLRSMLEYYVKDAEREDEIFAEYLRRTEELY